MVRAAKVPGTWDELTSLEGVAWATRNVDLAARVMSSLPQPTVDMIALHGDEVGVPNIHRFFFKVLEVMTGSDKWKMLDVDLDDLYVMYDNEDRYIKFMIDLGFRRWPEVFVMFEIYDDLGGLGEITVGRAHVPVTSVFDKVMEMHRKAEVMEKEIRMEHGDGQD